jgi:hypothetical protein
MKPSLIIALVLSITSLSTTGMLFWDRAPKSSRVKTATSPSIEMKWGEGSEAGVPDTAIHKPQ